MDDTEAFNLGFSRKTVNNINEALSFAGYKSYTLIKVKPSLSENMVVSLTPFLPLLMLIGIAGLLMIAAGLVLSFQSFVIPIHHCHGRKNNNKS